MAAASAMIPTSLVRSESDLPFVPFCEGVTFQLLQADIEAGVWVVRVRFAPGASIPRHKHTGEVHGFTTKGSWRYLEYPEVNVAGSYIFEPAGSTHTLHVPESNPDLTEVCFVVRGANLNLSDQGNVESVLDAASVLEMYQEGCRQASLPIPKVIGI